MVCHKDTSRAGLGGEVPHLRASVKERLEAVVGQTNVLLALGSGARRTTNRHAETLESIRSGIEAGQSSSIIISILTGLKTVMGCCLRLSRERSYWV